MARSNKPLIWLPFAAGGTLAAFVMPAVILVLLLAALGAWPEQAFTYERMHAFVAHPVSKLILFVALGLPLWHAAHRLRMTLQDLGVRRKNARRTVAQLCYGVAVIATLVLLYSLLPVS